MKIYATTTPEMSIAEKQHMELSRRLAGECVVLLENDGALPIREKGKVALYGTGARMTIKGGSGSGEVNSRFSVNVEQGLKEAGFRITTENWLERYDKKLQTAQAEYRTFIRKKAKEQNCPEFIAEFSFPFKGAAPEEITDKDIRDSETDTAIYVITRNSGEGADRDAKEGDYYLFKEEKEGIEKLAKAYEKLIVVLNVGAVMDMAELKAIPGINAVVLMSQLGNIGGLVLADVLSGAVNPSGKLTDTWAKEYMDYPSSQGFSHNDGNVADEYYTEDIYVGYRYFDTFGVEPVYPFGYGKSYTDFSIVTKGVRLEKNQIQIQTEVTNTGSVFAGKEVVQVYYSAPDGTLEKPYQELAAFEKTKLLAPGESQLLTITFQAEAMASYCSAKEAWILEKGDYIIRIGNSSRNTTAAAKIIVKEDVVTEKCKNVFPLDEELQELSAKEKAEGELEVGVTLNRAEDEPGIELTLNKEDIVTKVNTYQTERKLLENTREEILTMQDVLEEKCTVEELVAQLSIQELAEYCVGTQRTSDNSVVGNASYTVPGAAGDTSSVCKESRGIKNMILADGPAGLRLQPHFKTDKEGNLLPGGAMLGGSFVPFDAFYNEENSVDYYQYCTAIPIGWALAQAWNPQMLEQVGVMVGEEMQRFNVDIWLAPALNIHRNPLCGRNFEYYSEDPLVSGKAAGAITRGVQSHKEKGACIKHFAANSQEDNRYFSNSHVSERAMREIYLKGFEITIKETQPLSVMTSYNLINGIHTANHYGLIQNVCRDEWGFEGTVMTDWFTSQDVAEITGKSEKYDISASTGCIFAGNDMQMPGCEKNVDDIVRAVTSGEEVDGYTITLADLQYNAANVIRVAAKIMKN